MKYELAESILKNTMTHWEATRVPDEMRDIQIISEIKYDDYQQYTHGMRYVESLALWMQQFDSPSDKECAYKFIKENLLFVSEEEMRQLVTYSYPIIMKKYLIEKTRRFCSLHSVAGVENRKKIYNYFRRTSLFLGLSDGAHIDFFRRQNAELSNEQVVVHYDFSAFKAEDMVDELKKDQLVKNVVEQYGECINPAFSSYYLIDDFTGSGNSYIRKDEKGWHGKIPKFFDRLKDEYMQKKGYGADDCEIHLVLYIATDKALEHIRTYANEYAKEKGGCNITVESVQKIAPLNWNENSEFDELLKMNYKKYKELGYRSYEDSHFEKGKGRIPYHGFADGSLPLILYHNTPNNSLPILWYSWENKITALFPRVTRHKEN